MHLLVPLAALLGIEVESITARIRNTIIVNVVMLGLALVGAGFLLVAGFLGLAELYGPIYAALILAGVFLVLALAVYLGTRIGENRHRREVADKRKSTETSAFVTTAALTALPVVLRSPMGRAIAIPAAAVAAYLLLRRSGPTKED
ncbi:MAG TPA: phage holin family protein [Devosia sp.]|nr:phage holin family protein [Devosia sp.]